MKLGAYFVMLAVVLVTFCAAQTQTTGNSTVTSAEVPRLIRFSGVAKDESGKPMTGTPGITFLFYKDEKGGAPLWMETQNVQADSNGRYTVLLGSATLDGVPLGVFSSAEAHWISTQISGLQESARVLLLSVPYALKAADAETLGGMPASAFVQASPAGTISTTTTSKGTSNSANNATPSATVAGSGTTNFIPLWTSSTALGNSILYQTGGNVGVATKTPGAKLDTLGTTIAVRGTSSGTTKGATGVYGAETSTKGFTYGVQGSDASPNGVGVYGNNTALGYGVYGASTKTGAGVGIGVVGIGSSIKSIGVAGVGAQYGVTGTAGNDQPNAAGVYGAETSVTSTYPVYGVEGLVKTSQNGTGVYGVAQATTGSANGVFGQTASVGGAGGLFQNTNTGTGAQILVAEDGSGTQRFSVDTHGNVNVITGTTTQVKGPLSPVNHARATIDVTTTSGDTALVTLNWSFPFPDTNYTASCSVLDPYFSNGGEGPGTWGLNITAISATSLQVGIGVYTGSNRTITLHCIGVHD